MSSNKRLKVILSKVDWCGHCKDFLPVFNESKNLIKNNKTLKNVSVDFEVYDMEQDKGIFQTKYEKLVDKVEGYPTVFLAQIKNDKLSKTVEIGHAQKSEDFVKLIGDAYKSFSNQTGGNLEDDMYKQKYLKYKAKYLQYKAQKGGRIELSAKHKCATTLNPVFTFDDDMKIIKDTSAMGIGKSSYKFFKDNTCSVNQPLENLLNSLTINQIYKALVELLKNYNDNPVQFKHFNQLLLSLIILYLQRIDEHFKTLTDKINELPDILKTLNHINERIIVSETSWCKLVKKNKLKCGDKDIEDGINLNTLLEEAISKGKLKLQEATVKEKLKIMLSNLKDDCESLAILTKLNNEKKIYINYLVCLCAEIIIEYYNKYANYNIPLLVLLIKIEAYDLNLETFNRGNSLSALTIMRINELLEKRLEDFIAKIFNDNPYVDHAEQIKKITAELRSPDKFSLEEFRQTTLYILKEKNISTDIFCTIKKIIIEILNKIKGDINLFPQFLYFVHTQIKKFIPEKDIRKIIFVINLYYLRFLVTIIFNLATKDKKHCYVLVAAVMQNLFNSFIKEDINPGKPKIDLLISFDEEIGIVKDINSLLDTQPNDKPDKFKEITDGCTLPLGKHDDFLSKFSEPITQ